MINASFYYSKGGISLIIIEAERVLDALCCLKELNKFMAKLNFTAKLCLKLARYFNTIYFFIIIIYQKLKYLNLS